MNNKRKTLQKIAGIGAIATVVPSSWIKPVIGTVVLPAHAQTSVIEPTLSIPDITIGDLAGMSPFNPLTPEPDSLDNGCISGICDYSDLAIAQFTTNCDSGCSYSQTGLPAGVSIDTNTGDISGIYDSSAIETFFVTVTVTSLGGSATDTFILTFVDEG